MVEPKQKEGIVLNTIDEDLDHTDGEGFLMKQWYELTEEEQMKLIKRKQNEIIQTINQMLDIKVLTKG